MCEEGNLLHCPFLPNKISFLVLNFLKNYELSLVLFCLEGIIGCLKWRIIIIMMVKSEKQN